MTERLNTTFDRLSADNKAAFIAYMMGGDPDLKASESLLSALPGAGVDIIELGVPFTDPVADGPVIEAAGHRALAAGASLDAVLDMAARFRRGDDKTPLILMGYANPVHHMGYKTFAERASRAGIDGAIIVDLPPEEDAELRAAFAPLKLALIRLTTPTTDAARLPTIVRGAQGFLYYVSVTGVTGAASAKAGDIKGQAARIKTASGLPVVAGFGVKTPKDARAFAKVTDGVVVGSAIVDRFHKKGKAAALTLTQELSQAVHGAREP